MSTLTPNDLINAIENAVRLPACEHPPTMVAFESFCATRTESPMPSDQ